MTNADVVANDTDASLTAAVTGRTESLFCADMDARHEKLSRTIAESRIMVIGAAGSVGTAFVRQLVDFSPGCLHLIDINENNLVETVREMRSAQYVLPADFQTLPIGLGMLEFDRFLADQAPYDFILNFSALKHVRSEKDPFSLMRMFMTNVGNVRDLLEKLTTRPVVNTFSVSSDKAVEPHSILGATKILMERVHLLYADHVPFTSARFANVAFSDGSLLHGFRMRLLKRQPLAAPMDIRRYFISHEEAGQLCLLSCFLGENRDVFFPRLDEGVHLVTLSEIAAIFLRAHGLEPEVYETEQEAKLAAARLDSTPGKWPCWFFPSDTTGEKPFEVFHSVSEEVDLSGYQAVGVVRRPPLDDTKPVLDALTAFERIRHSRRWHKEDMVDAMRIAVPELQHEEKGRNLDQRM